ncbi:MAG: carotenoid biosynthesis protein [Planctomycetes bacterium]|nr:carotenoid biosynthesis protein [Planctomycetota bacterium]
MAEFLRLLWGTVMLRPYVFLFLGAFLLIARTQMGWTRTFLWLATGYTIAWASEFSSIQNGFPYGRYEYLPAATQGRELWVPWWTEGWPAVPFFDSLSYVFLTYVSYQMALQFRSPAVRRGRFDFEVRSTDAARYGWRTTLLAAFLVMTLDVVIDPVAHLGKRWFLGRIYRYPAPGPYFDVPLSNFAGWFLVGALVVAANQALGAGLALLGRPPAPSRHFLGKDWFPPALFFGILAFNLGVTFAIGERLLGIVGVFVSAPVLVLYLATVPGRAASMTN